MSIGNLLQSRFLAMGYATTVGVLLFYNIVPGRVFEDLGLPQLSWRDTSQTALVIVAFGFIVYCLDVEDSTKKKLSVDREIIECIQRRMNDVFSRCGKAYLLPNDIYPQPYFTIVKSDKTLLHFQEELMWNGFMWSVTIRIRSALACALTIGVAFQYVVAIAIASGFGCSADWLMDGGLCRQTVVALSAVILILMLRFKTEKDIRKRQIRYCERQVAHALDFCLEELVEYAKKRCRKL